MIGIIGGNGVAATNKLLELVEETCTREGAFRDAHHPELLVWQATQAPSRSMYLEGRGASFIEDYIVIAKKLCYCGADPICMCCNTAHYALDEICNKAHVRMIDLIAETIIEIKKTGAKKIALLASEGALKAKIYEKKIQSLYPELSVIYPDSSEQKLVTKGICNVKNKNRFLDIKNHENPFYIFDKLRIKMRKKNADIVVMGCTDIGVVYPEQEDTVDSLRVLARTIYKEYRK